MSDPAPPLTVRPATSGYLPELDGIRALAIGLVLFSHSVIYDQFNAWRPVGLQLGHFGVVLFFVLSGYLITRLLLREEQRNGRVSLTKFYIRRALRLLPALLVYLSVIFALWCCGLVPRHPWHSFVSSILYIRNLVGHGHETDHLWSLSIEEQFYLLWPPALIWLGRHHTWRVPMVAGAIGAICAWRSLLVALDRVNPGALYMRTDLRFDTLLVGCLLALLENRRSSSTLNENPPPLWRALKGGWPFGGFVALLSGWTYLSIYFPGVRAVESTVIAVLLCGLMYSVMGAEGSILGRMFKGKPVVAMGRISYGIYLWQGLFLGPSNTPLAWLRQFPFGLILALAVAITSYRVVELPFLRWKAKSFRP